MLKQVRDARIQEELVRRSLTGDNAAFGALVGRYCGMVHAVAFARLQNRETAEDLTQEVFLRVFLNLDKLTNPRFFGTWVSRIARNLSADWVRRDQRKSTLLTMVSLDDGLAATHDIKEREVQSTLENRDLAQAAHAAIMELPEAQREIVLLHYGEGMNLNEIAKVLEVHPTTAGRHLKEALETLRSSVSESRLPASAKTFAANKKLASRSAAAVAAAAVITGEAKASLAAAAQLDPSLHVVTASAGLGLKSVLAAKTAAAAVGVAALLFGGITVKASLDATPKAVTNAAVTAGASGENAWPSGIWCGPAKFPDAKRPIRIVYDVERLQDGSYHVTCYSPDEGFMRIGGTINVAGDSITVSHPKITAQFNGLKSANNQIKGEFKREFTQEKNVLLPLMLTRIDSTPIATAHALPPIDREAAKRFTGSYAAGMYTTASVVMTDGGLEVRTSSFPLTGLVRIADNVFTADRVMRITFGTTPNGTADRMTLTMQLGEQKTTFVLRKL